MALQYFKHDGLRLAYEDFPPAGPALGETVVLVMGTGSPGRVWNSHQVPALTGAGYRVVVLTNRGIAPSDTGARDFTIDDMAGDVVALIEHIGAERVALIGTSLGARIVTEVALARPDLVACVIALAAHARLDPVQRAMIRGEIAMADQPESVPITYRAAVDALQYLSPATLADDRRAQDWIDMLSLDVGPISPGHRAQLVVSAQLKDRREAYREVTRPYLALAFADDAAIAPRLSREVAAAIPGASYREIAEAGHYGYLEQPEAVNALLLSFLASRADAPPQERN